MKKHIFPSFCFLITILACYNYYALSKNIPIQCENTDTEKPELINESSNELKIQKLDVIVKNDAIKTYSSKIQYIEAKNLPQWNARAELNQQELNIPLDDVGVSNLLIANGQFAEADKILKVSLNKDIEQGYIDLMKTDKLREVYAKQGNLKGYIDFLRNLPDNVDKASLIEDQIRYSMENGISNYDELIPLAKSEIAKNNGNNDLSYHLADLYAAKSDYQNAIVVYENSLNVNQNNPYAYYQLGNAYRSIGDMQSSEQAFYNASVLSPEYATMIAREKQQISTP
jgi:tetratricopeptide (TPR) repeat protein